jgi:hypothetical protein
VITWQFWTLIGVFLVVGLDLSFRVGEIADHLEILNAVLVDLARATREDPDSGPLAPLLPLES